MKNVIKILPALAIIVLSVMILIPISIILIPISAMVLDILMIVNLAFALLILLIAKFAKEIKELALFPILILLSTVFSLANNLSAVRLICTQGANFNGRLIRLIFLPLFNSGQIGQIVGYSIFILLMSILDLVIAKGGIRVSKLAALFTHDGMRKKMFTIEFEFSSGKITEEEAALGKQKVQHDSDFFGALDGANKFVSGNVKLVIILNFVIIIAGILLEYFYRGSSINDVIGLYLGLAAGTCFLFMFPPILLSIAMGIVVKRVKAGGGGESVIEKVRGMWLN